MAVADGNLALQPIGLGQADFTKYFDDYSSKLENSMKSSFGDTSTAFSQMQNGYEAHYLKFEKAG